MKALSALCTSRNFSISPTHAMRLRQGNRQDMQKPIQHSPICYSTNHMPAELEGRLLSGRNEQHRHRARPIVPCQTSRFC